MARTHSSHTPSPTRKRSPARLAASEDGSQYEMDLDALGLNSTFESTALEEGYEVPERVDDTDVEGPEDFTVNMTYWMTADLRAVKSGNDAQADTDHRASTTASPTVRVDRTASHDLSTPASDRSMAHDEKVRSFLSALPDTDLDHVHTDLDHVHTDLDHVHTDLDHVHTGLDHVHTGLDHVHTDLPTGTPLRAPRQSMLQLPRSSPPKARSLQPTVEDSNTPRKPTQQTVIHHPSPKPSSDGLADLQSRFEHQELASRTRITELETILSFTRTELETARNENYKQKDSIARLEDGHKAQLEQRDQLTQQASADKTDLLHKLTSVQARADSFQLDLARATAEAKAAREESQAAREESQAAREESQAAHEESQAAQRELQAAREESQAARAESQAREAANAASKSNSNHQLSRIANLESQLKDARFSLECAQADVAAKEQLFQTNLTLNTVIRALRSELEAQRTALAGLSSRHNKPDEQMQPELAAKDQLIEQHVAERDNLERQLSTAQGRIAGLETSLASLRAQLADAHRETGTVRAEAERLTQDLEDANDRLIDARAEADRRVSDVEKKLANTKDLKVEAENRFRELKSQHDDLAEGHSAMLEDVRSKAEDAVLKTGALLAQERKEKSKLKKDIERLQREINNRTSHEPEHTPSDSDSEPPTPTSPFHPDPKDAELASLRSTLKSTLSHLKTLKKNHKTTLHTLRASHEATLSTLRTDMDTLHQRLETQARDHAAVNAALDEQLSVLLSKVVKEKARAVVGKRDGQWEEVQKDLARERELLGRVVMTQWGREEFGPREGKGQVYGYRFVRRER